MLSGPVAARHGLAGCRVCGMLARLSGRHGHCPRCGSRLHLRKPASLSRCWAFLLTAAGCYLPANLLPVMHTGAFTGDQDDTILSGVAYLWTSGSWPLGALVFVASIVVPLLKMLALLLLLLAVHRGLRWQPMQRLKLYRLLEFVGRWSMLDIYVITLLAGLVQVQGFATVAAGPGAAAFGAVVVCTMLASQSFDPRLIWDSMPVAEEPAAPAAPTHDGHARHA